MCVHVHVCACVCVCVCACAHVCVCVHVQVLCRALEASGTFGAQQVIRNESGEEVSLQSKYMYMHNHVCTLYVLHQRA